MKSDNWKIIPEVGADAFFILPVGVGVSVNTEAVTPSIGITLINAIEFSLFRLKKETASNP